MITFNGLTSDEILALPDDVLERTIVSGEALVFQAGSADVLGRFWINDKSLVLELGHIDGGGEGVLPAIAVLAQRFASRRDLDTIDWRVHAVSCPQPNLKLRRLMERRGFRVTDVPGTGVCYHKRLAIGRSAG
jgi:hypothetical protein